MSIYTLFSQKITALLFCILALNSCSPTKEKSNKRSKSALSPNTPVSNSLRQKDSLALISILEKNPCLSEYWVRDSTINGWNGVHIKDKRVVKLYLSSHLINSVPKETGNLSALKTLSITKEDQWIRGKQKNDTLYQDTTKITTLPAEIGKLKHLKSLTITHQNISSLPQEIGMLTNLSYLYLNNNQLIKLPAEIGKLKNLTIFDLTRNKLATLPDEITKISSLSNLKVAHNSLTKIPNSIGKIVGLTLLELDNNQLKSLPSSLGTLQYLEELSLEHNNITMLPKEITRLRSLQKFNIGQNRLHKQPLSPAVLLWLDKHCPDWRITPLNKEIRSVARLHIPMLQHSFRERGKQNPLLPKQGKVLMELSVAPTGEVLQTLPIRSTLYDTLFENQLVEHIMLWNCSTFAKEDDTLEIVYPFFFSR